MGNLWPYEPSAFSLASPWVPGIRMISCQSHDVIAALPTLGGYGGKGAPRQPGNGSPAGDQMHIPPRTIGSVPAEGGSAGGNDGCQCR
jgi:hypothetical protein